MVHGVSEEEDVNGEEEDGNGEESDPQSTIKAHAGDGNVTGRAQRDHYARKGKEVKRCEVQEVVLLSA